MSLSNAQYFGRRSNPNSIFTLIRDELLTILYSVASTKGVIHNDEVETIVDQALRESHFCDSVYDAINSSTDKIDTELLGSGDKLATAYQQLGRRRTKQTGVAREIVRKIIFERIDELNLQNSSTTAASSDSVIEIVSNNVSTIVENQRRLNDIVTLPMQSDLEGSELSKSELNALQKSEKEKPPKVTELQQLLKEERTVFKKKPNDNEIGGIKMETLMTTRETILFMLNARETAKMIKDKFEQQTQIELNATQQRQQQLQQQHELQQQHQQQQQVSHKIMIDIGTTMGKNIKVRSLSEMPKIAEIYTQTEEFIVNSRGHQFNPEAASRPDKIRSIPLKFTKRKPDPLHIRKIMPNMTPLQLELLSKDYFAVLLEEITYLLKSAFNLSQKTRTDAKLTHRDVDEARRKIVQLEVVQNMLIIRKLRFFIHVLRALEYNIELMKGIVAVGEETLFKRRHRRRVERRDAQQKKQSKTELKRDTEIPGNVVVDQTIERPKLENKIRAKIERRIRNNLEVREKNLKEFKIEPQSDTKIEQRRKIKRECTLERKLEAEAEMQARLEVKIEARLRAEMEAKLEAKLKPKLEAKLQARLKAKFEKKYRTKYEQKYENYGSKLQQQNFDENIEQKNDYRTIENKLENKIQNKIQQQQQHYQQQYQYQRQQQQQQQQQHYQQQPQQPQQPPQQPQQPQQTKAPPSKISTHLSMSTAKNIKISGKSSKYIPEEQLLALRYRKPSRKFTRKAGSSTTKTKRYGKEYRVSSKKAKIVPSILPDRSGWKKHRRLNKERTTTTIQETGGNHRGNSLKKIQKRSATVGANGNTITRIGGTTNIEFKAPNGRPQTSTKRDIDEFEYEENYPHPCDYNYNFDYRNKYMNKLPSPPTDPNRWKLLKWNCSNNLNYVPSVDQHYDMNVHSRRFHRTEGGQQQQYYTNNNYNHYSYYHRHQQQQLEQQQQQQNQKQYFQDHQEYQYQQEQELEQEYVDEEEEQRREDSRHRHRHHGHHVTFSLPKNEFVKQRSRFADVLAKYPVWK